MYPEQNFRNSPSPPSHEDALSSSFSEGVKVASAVCLRKSIKGKAKNTAGGKNKIEKHYKKTFSFALSWDNPVVRFGEGARETDRSNTSGSEAASTSIGFEAPRYYTRFFGNSGNSSSAIAVYGLVHAKEWEKRIVKWQEKVLQECDSAMVSRDSTADLTDRESSSNSSGKTDSVAAAYSSDTEERYRPPRDKQGPSESYRHQLFNELYFLVDGGTVWTDTQNGVSNPCAPCPVQSSAGDRRGSLGSSTVTNDNRIGRNVGQSDAVPGDDDFKEKEAHRRSGMFCDILSSALSVPMKDFSIENFLNYRRDCSDDANTSSERMEDRYCEADILVMNRDRAKDPDPPSEPLLEPLIQRLSDMLSWGRGKPDGDELDKSGVTGVGVGLDLGGSSRSNDGDRKLKAAAGVEEHRHKSRNIMKAIHALHQHMLEHDKKVAASKVAGDQVLC